MIKTYLRATPVSRMVMDLRLCVDKIVVVWAIRVMDLVSRGVVTTFSSVVIHERGARDGATQVLLLVDA